LWNLFQLEIMVCIAVGVRGAVGEKVMALPDFGRSVNPTSIRGADYSHITGLPLPPIFFKPSYGPGM
jgi:hypothetical protein